MRVNPLVASLANVISRIVFIQLIYSAFIYNTFFGIPLGFSDSMKQKARATAINEAEEGQCIEILTAHRPNA